MNAFDSGRGDEVNFLERAFREFLREIGIWETTGPQRKHTIQKLKGLEGPPWGKRRRKENDWSRATGEGKKVWRRSA
jgi:hypothetical protein